MLNKKMIETMENVMKKENEKKYDVACGIFFALMFALFFAMINEKVVDGFFYPYLKDKTGDDLSLVFEYYLKFSDHYSLIFSIILGFAFTHIAYMPKIIGFPILIIGVLDIICGFYFNGFIDCVTMLFASFMGIFFVFAVFAFLFNVGEAESKH